MAQRWRLLTQEVEKGAENRVKEKGEGADHDHHFQAMMKKTMIPPNAAIFLANYLCVSMISLLRCVISVPYYFSVYTACCAL